MEELGVALVAHPSNREELLRFIGTHECHLSQFSLYATEETGQLIQSSTGLPVTQTGSESEDGYEQITMLVASGRVQAVIMLWGSSAFYHNDLNILHLTVVCNMYNICLATNTATSEAILSFFDYIEDWAGSDFAVEIIASKSKQCTMEPAMQRAINCDEVPCPAETNVSVDRTLHSLPYRNRRNDQGQVDPAEEPVICATG